VTVAATPDLRDWATRSWRGLTKADPEQAWWVPGRIELLGKHTDYGGGRSLLCAIDRGIFLLAGARRDGTIRVWDAVRGEGISFAQEAPAAPSWAVYPGVVARRLAQDFSWLGGGADLVFASNLPPASGMSSSSALMIAVFLGLAAGTPILDQLGGREQWAAYVAAVEGGKAWRRAVHVSGVGTHGGSEDHTAILCCKPNTWSQYRFCPVRHEADYAAPHGCRLVIGVSGVVAQKTGAARAAYNRAARLGGAVLEVWNAACGRADATLNAACASGPETVRAVLAGARHAEFTVPELEARFEQFWLESEVLIPAAGAALNAGDWATLGELAAQSQHAAEHALGNQVPETVALVALARAHGALAASAFGAGFGGAVWALAPVSESEAFRTAWQQAYASQFPQRAAASQFFLTAAAAAAAPLPVTQ
jgi:galactokinase